MSDTVKTEDKLDPWITAALLGIAALGAGATINALLKVAVDRAKRLFQA